MISLKVTWPTFEWSVRREWWENRSLWMAPVVVAGVILVGALLGMAVATRVAAGDWHGDWNYSAYKAAGAPFLFVLAVMAVVRAVTASLYCMGAILNERRDRSILFWKSMPVSDLTAVLAKFATALGVTVAASFVVTIALELVLMILATLGMALHGFNPFPVWRAAPLLDVTALTAWLMLAGSLWYAPIYAWLLLVSSWAKRSALLWSLAPPVGIMIIEGIAFNTNRFGAFLGDRLNFMGHGFNGPIHPHSLDMSMSYIDLVGFLTDPGLWGASSSPQSSSPARSGCGGRGRRCDTGANRPRQAAAGVDDNAGRIASTPGGARGVGVAPVLTRRPFAQSFELDRDALQHRVHVHRERVVRGFVVEGVESLHPRLGHGPLFRRHLITPGVAQELAELLG
jgi:ABC-2 type transport system permease protein